MNKFKVAQRRGRSKTIEDTKEKILLGGLMAVAVHIEGIGPKLATTNAVFTCYIIPLQELLNLINHYI